MAYKKKMSPWLVVFMVIFYPVGICYLLYKVIKWIVKYYNDKKLQSDAKAVPDSSPAPSPVREYVPRISQKLVDLAQNRLDAIPRLEFTPSSDLVPRRLAADYPEMRFSTIYAKTKESALFPFVAIDVETSGLSQNHDIVEISAIKYEDGFNPVSCYTTLVHPRKPIPADASKINGITDEMVADAPAIGSIADEISSYISGCNLVGHNLDFDLKFMFCSGIRIPEKVRLFDTLAISRRYDKDVFNHKLATVCEEHYIPILGAHRSLADAFATAELFCDYCKDIIE